MFHICKFNGVTKPFQYPIPRCEDSVTVLNIWAHRIWIIILYACQVYHQVVVQPTDQVKLALFAPNNHEYRFSVMPFLPTNVPTFSSAMMSNFKDEWGELFIIRVKALSYING